MTLDQKSRRTSSSTSSSGCTVKTRRQYSSEAKPTSRRHSETTASILSSMQHPNIIYATDFQPANLITDLQIPHIHLGTLMNQAGKLSSREADCYIMQLLSGLSYPHSLNVTHRDISPSNLLLTSTGNLKIANFTSSEHLKSSNNFKSSKCCGTMPYIAPEVFVETVFGAKPVDMWSVGVLYMEIRYSKVLWEMAGEGADEGYDRYLRDRFGLGGFRPVENLKNVHFRRVVRSLLDPCPGNRMTTPQVLKSKWCLETEIGAAALGEEIRLAE
ncbi:kinase-like domain-containing protein [Rhexocercosporidium sp. MPI-PUGE-AT-0058]|nr:kinase-like domain-containing protein [Rhexocercosporidium sp. MPI-PUGE-AT-0058]